MEVLAALQRIGHVLYRERQVRESLGLAVLEAELAVPALQFGVLANYADADSLN